MPECVFCRIIAGEAQADKVFEDEACIALLDRRPLFPGHCLLVPKQHCETLPELPDELLSPVFANVRMLARAVEDGLDAEGSFIAINNKVSQSVPHLHIHIVPRRKKDGLKGFFWPRQSYRDDTHIADVVKLLRAAIARIKTGS